MPFIHISMKIVKATFDIFGGDRYVTIVIAEIFRDKQGIYAATGQLLKEGQGILKKQERERPPI